MHLHGNFVMRAVTLAMSAMSLMTLCAGCEISDRNSDDEFFCTSNYQSDAKNKEKELPIIISRVGHGELRLAEQPCRGGRRVSVRIQAKAKAEFDKLLNEMSGRCEMYALYIFQFDGRYKTDDGSDYLDILVIRRAVRQDRELLIQHLGMQGKKEKIIDRFLKDKNCKRTDETLSIDEDSQKSGASIPN